MLQFLRNLPKIELHAHLNGSLNIDSIRELAAKVYGVQTKEFSTLCERFIKFEKGAKLDDCFEKFGFVHELTSTKEGLEYATELVIRDFAKDNVIYVELRTTPKANGNMSRRSYLDTVLGVIKKKSDLYKIKVKLLPSINRAEPVAVAEETVALAVELATVEPEIIVGIDFSGNPNQGNFKDFIPVLSKARNHGLKLAMHCAEVDNPVEIREMIRFGMSRCGHGTYLSDSGFEHMKEENIPIECCLTSNVKSGTVANIGVHHLKQLMATCAPKVLCTDDSGVFDTTLSDEFFLATESFGLTKSQCIALTMEAVEHAFATREEKLMLKMQIYKYTRLQNK
ncbi:PREDICTED: adenosine deaminase-like protein [Drosophila arizonae]|uniref:Adenosine deaminase-like protein n=1 Tax=Drosophila arizonae TaxID=7263 RepID=A0ABM1NM18_DROAR|nr:PREDICTED: adenosine deaminase-like protein [Drosophila arizonae]